MTFHATDRLGRSIKEPTSEQMKLLIESLSEFDPEHPDISLSHESEWCISLFHSGAAVFENVETGDGPWHMEGLSPSAAFELWKQLSMGHIDLIQKLPWAFGYGPNA